MLLDIVKYSCDTIGAYLRMFGEGRGNVLPVPTSVPDNTFPTSKETSVQSQWHWCIIPIEAIWTILGSFSCHNACSRGVEAWADMHTLKPHSLGT